MPAVCAGLLPKAAMNSLSLLLWPGLASCFHALSEVRQRKRFHPHLAKRLR